MTVHEFRRAAEPPPTGPSNIEAEQALLGAILINNDAFNRVSDFLKADHFYEEIHRRVFDVASQLIRAGKVATPVTLKTFLGDGDLGEGLTIPKYLARLAAGATAIINAKDYGRTIYDLAVRRDLVDIGRRLVTLAHDQPVDKSTTEVATGSVEELQRIIVASPSDPVRSVREVSDDLVRQVDKVLSGASADSLVTTGYSDLDQAINGYEPGTLVIVAGRPGMGKTMFASSSGYRCARSGVGVLEMPLEIGPEQMVARHLADIAFSGASSPAFRNIGRHATDLDEAQVASIRDAHRKLRALPIQIDGRSRVTISQIAAEVAQQRRLMRGRGVELGLVVLDHLDFIAASDRYRGQRTQEIGEIVVALKDIARSHDICVLLLSQLSREVERRAQKDRRPTLADLRNSGDLEQVADVVAFLFRDEYYAGRSSEYLTGDPAAIDAALAARGKIEIIVAKNRSGPTPTIHLFCDPASSSISSYERARR